MLHPFSRLLILISILIDCIFCPLLILPKWRPALENMLLGIYTFEILVKLIARGVYLRGSFYFFVIHGLAWLQCNYEYTIRYSPLNFFPIFRIARNLRILKIIPLNQGLKSWVGILLHYLKKHIGVIIPCFFLSILSLIGMGFSKQPEAYMFAIAPGNWDWNSVQQNWKPMLYLR